MKAKTPQTLIALLSILTLVTACSQAKMDYLDINESHMPSAGLSTDPEGSDLLSSSTNHSAKTGDTHPKIDSLKGAAFIKPPQINHFGSVSLGYQMEIPAGRAGLEPRVGLGYSSSSGDGLLGIGWSLSTGLGVISRTTQNGQLYYDERDIFTYNGSRMVKVSGSSGAEDGIYRLEIESEFLRFELTGSASGGTWRVFDASGRITLYGEDAYSRISRPDNSSLTYSWYYSRGMDLNGNSMEAIYDGSEYEEKHILYLSEIRYTGNLFEGISPRQYARFHIKDRDDFYVSKAPGFIMKMDKLLDYVEVGWDDPYGSSNTELWRYTMVYEKSGDSNRSLLKTVRSTRTGTQPEFEYQKAEHSLQWELVSNPDYQDYDGTTMNPETIKYFEGDFNGDGISDLAFFNPATGDWKITERQLDGSYAFRTYANRFKGYGGDSKIQFFKGNVTGDYNGDGKSDIAFYLPETREFYIAISSGYNFTFKQYGKLSLTNIDIFKCEWFPGDFDGDGISDIVLFNEPAGEWILMKNTGSTFTFIKFSYSFKNVFRSDYLPSSSPAGTSSTSDASTLGTDRDKVHFLSGDYNGDGRTDISIYDARDGKWWVAENYRDSVIGFKLQWKLYKVFTAPEMSLFGQDRFSGDFNGDGFSDFLVFNRDTGEWIMGETGNGTITFKTYSRAPQFKDITKWLQGDFNGDGRTDIGFYSKTDGNFWIGEATPDGFRYRIYNNMRYGPNKDVLEKAPLPFDDVVVTDDKILLNNTTTSKSIEYQYDGNQYSGHGERPFIGYFMNQVTPGMLIFYKTFDVFKYKPAGSSASPEEIKFDDITTDIEAKNITILNDGKPDKVRGNDGIMYYSLGSFAGNPTHDFKLIYNNNEVWKDAYVAYFTNSEIPNYKQGESLCLIDNFIAGKSNKYVLILDDQNSLYDTPFCLFTSDGLTQEAAKAYTRLNVKMLNIPTDIEELNFKHIFGSDSSTSERPLRQQFRFFSGRFTAAADEPAQVLMVDMRNENEHRWYLGTIADASITFELLTYKNDSDSPATQNSLFVDYGLRNYRVVGNQVFYITVCNEKLSLHTALIKIDENSGEKVYSQTHSDLSSVDYLFKGEFDYEGNAIVHESDKLIRIKPYTHLVNGVDGEGGFKPVLVKINRDDLYQKVYPYKWVQGDYNGDGKTDIGIFHLGEKNWYFANTTGTVPDLLYRVNNGMGGSYEMSYINSTTCDNNDEDGVSHLPMNYKVCDRLTVDDGLGNRAITKYEYAKGYAYSAFINGKKETDYFGFGEFRVIDPTGAKSISYYHNIFYDDFRKNRALAGAIKESIVYGSDLKIYSKKTYEYELHEISPATGIRSFLVDPAAVYSYSMNYINRQLKLVEKREVSTGLLSGQYVINNKTEKLTDYYDDGIHVPQTIVNYSVYDYTQATNEMRVISKVNFQSTVFATASAYLYDSRGNLTKETVSYTGGALPSAAPRVMDYSYDAFGNLVQKTNSSGSPYRTTRYSYDSALRQFKTAEIAESDSGDLVTGYDINYASAFGGINSKTDPNGNSTFYKYDKYGRLVQVEAITDSGRQTTTEYSYIDTFPLGAKAVNYSGSPDMNSEACVFFDGAGRVIHSIMSSQEESGRRYVKSGKIVYDDMGRIIRKSQPSFAADSEMGSFIANREEKNPTITEYDPVGRVKRITLPKGSSTEPETYITNTYNDPFETIETHSIGRSKRTVKNARGQVLYIEDSGFGDDGAAAHSKIGFAYDLAGRRVKKMDLNNAAMDASVPACPSSPLNAYGDGLRDSSGNNAAYWWYDGLGGLVASSDPDLGYSGFQLNAFGEAAAAANARGQVTSMFYDRLGRMTQKVLPGNEGVVEYIYDTLTGSDNAKGRLVAIDDPAQRKEMSYDKLGRVKKEVRSFKGLGDREQGLNTNYETLFEHDLLGRQTRITYPVEPMGDSRTSVIYHYTSAGVKSIRAEYVDGTKDIIASVVYNEFGQMSMLTRGNGVATNYDYDNRMRLSSLVSTVNANGAFSSLQNVHYTFNIQDSITAVENTPDVGTDGVYSSVIRYNYNYDGLNRLTRASGFYQKTTSFGTTETQKYELGYAYTANGNLSRKDTLDPDSLALLDRWTYNYDNHAVTGITSSLSGSRFNMQYDASGNMIYQHDATKSLTKQMAYDSNNRIQYVTNPTTGEKAGEYWYDDQGFRVRKISRREEDGSQVDNEILYPNMYMGMELHTGGYEVVNNIYMNGVRVAAMIPNGGAMYFLTDQVDSVKLVVNDAGRAITRYEYKPYGEAWFTEGDDDFAPKYNSQELDKETNFYFYNARYYDPEIARFVTADNQIDSEFDTQGWNRFSYVKGNPIIYKDPTGHEDEYGNPDITDASAGGIQYSLGNWNSGSGKDYVTQNNIENTMQISRDRGQILKDQMTKLDGKNGVFNTMIGNTKVTILAENKQAAIDSIMGTNNNAIEVLADMSERFKLTNVTLTSLARKPWVTPVEGDPHRFAKYNNPDGGRGLDITYAESADGRKALFQDKPIKDPNGLLIDQNKNKVSRGPLNPESPLAKDITAYLQTHSKVSQVFTPYQMIDKVYGDGSSRPNEWREKSYEKAKLDWWHNSHMNITTY